MNELSRKNIDFDANWLFYKGNPSGAEEINYDDSTWRKLNVPHDWSIEGEFDENNESGKSGAFLSTGIGWYRKHFDLDELEENKQEYLYFDGVYHNSEVWCNGNYLGKHPYGFTGFYYDLTSYLNKDEKNIIAVKVDNSDQQNCRWYTGSGIYRHVEMIICDRVHVDHWGTYITTCLDSLEQATVTIQTTITNNHTVDKTISLKTSICDAKENEITTDEKIVRIEANKKLTISQKVVVQNPVLWSIDTPNLYSAKSEISKQGGIIDQYSTAFGIRNIEILNKDGIKINGKSIKLKGVNIHNDAGSLGTAVPDQILKSRLKTLKELGCNAIRCSHNPPAKELLDMCDEMGFLVIDEAFDKWWSGSYGEIFEAWWKKDLEMMLLRDRNHPSIFMWSVGNEVEDQGSTKTLDTLKLLVEHVHQFEPTRPVTCAIRPPGEVDGITNLNEKLDVIMSMANLTDVVSLNYQEQWYDDIKKRNPDIIITGSETYPFFRGTRDFFKGYEPVNPWFDVVANDHVIGQFIWAGIDYLGESMNWPSKGWAACLVDTTGKRKPLSYFQQSVWTEEPMVHIAVNADSITSPSTKMHWNAPKMASHWTFPDYENELIRIFTFTNCEKVELYINDELKGYKFLKDFPDKIMKWYLPYEAGEIKAVGYINDEKKCEHLLATSDSPYEIQLQADRNSIHADSKDVSAVEVVVVDEKGVVVPFAEHKISFDIDGEGEIIGVDNGNLDSSELYKAKERSAYHGRCRVFVQSKGNAGNILIRANAEGLKGAVAKILAI
ncbi:glycoside hydrolase family 2 TIM barrel-domain containing protein [Saliterribacillus persicus]|uniref:Beta-galactosidase n=1 Tax=Saliterribacillus persicus TaxID=930114 RepID=A0A368YAW2_9BACI|nr:glycoside hydrolase family 2 TIM barrel-domain containing protein [Saliterribacillus persicus]RCW77342.1 beta-galactosidase [Saliterribacillus persicus]